MTQRFLVIGSNSFSGASLVALLLRRGYSVVGISRSPEPDLVFLPYKWSDCGPGSSFTFHQLDLNRHLGDILAIVDSVRPEYVVNFAAQSMVAESWQHPDHWFETNVVATVRLHEGLRHCAFLHKYVHISTPEVYGSCDGKVDETAPFNPSTPYAVSRAAADLSLTTYFRQYGFPVVWTRAANIYGPGQQLYRLVPRTASFIKKGRKLPLHGGGSSRRSFIHCDDVAEATLAVALRGHVGQCYHVSTNRSVSIREVVEKICFRMGVALSDCVEIVDERPGKDAAYILDSSKLREQLSWKDHIALEDGIDHVVRWIGANWSQLKDQPVDYIHKA